MTSHKAQKIKKDLAPPPVEAIPDIDPAAETPTVVQIGKSSKKSKKDKKKPKKNKEAVTIRFDDEQLPQIDSRAAVIGLSRAAWVRMVVAQALAAKAE